MTLIIGTRGSKLATTQAGLIRDQLEYFGRKSELKIIKTPGDDSLSPVEKIGVGVFTQALREAMAAGECDIAVHSFKDLPTAPDPRFHLAVPKRIDAREALISRDRITLGNLPKGAKIGTSAPRRISQLKALRPDVEICPLRGNVDTRIAKVESGELDAIVVAYAGLIRLGLGDLPTEVFDLDRIIPAPAQGALAVECNESDSEAVTALRMINHADSHATAIAERSVLKALEAGCTAPVAAHATIGSYSGSTIDLTAGIFALDGSDHVVHTQTGPGSNAAALGEAVAAQLLEMGGSSWLK